MKPWNRKWFANSVFKLHWIYIRSETHNSFDSTRCIWSSLNWERDNPYHISKYNLASSWYFAETFSRNTTNEISRSALFLTICLVLGWQSHLCNGPNVEIAADQDYRHHGDRKCSIICTELSLINVKMLGQPYLWYCFQCKCTNQVKESRILFPFGRRRCSTSSDLEELKLHFQEWFYSVISIFLSRVSLTICWCVSICFSTHDPRPGARAAAHSLMAPDCSLPVLLKCCDKCWLGERCRGLTLHPLSEVNPWTCFRSSAKLSSHIICWTSKFISSWLQMQTVQ